MSQERMQVQMLTEPLYTHIPSSFTSPKQSIPQLQSPTLIYTNKPMIRTAVPHRFNHFGYVGTVVKGKLSLDKENERIFSSINNDIRCNSIGEPFIYDELMEC